MILCGNFSAKNNLVTLLISSQFTPVLTSWYSVLSMTQQNENFYKKCKKMSTELNQKQNQAKLAQVMVVCSTYLDERDFFTQFDEKRVCSNSVLKTKNEKNEVSMSALECVKSTILQIDDNSSPAFQTGLKLSLLKLESSTFAFDFNPSEA